MTDTEMVGEIRQAAEKLRDSDVPHDAALTWWLVDTLLLHGPVGYRKCERDGDEMPCADIRAAHKVAELILTES
ncbi:hypothetical protein [Streptomyces sp. NPDC019937]|uniref:hypothetical protein n=1 Tax=Streptomyces sp. NPDC019937 TaxID=3154787 RepID=UPI0034069E1A